MIGAESIRTSALSAKSVLYGTGPLSACRLGAVLQDMDVLQSHQPAVRVHHAVEHGKEGGDLLRAVDDLDDQRQVAGEAQDLGAVQMARMAKAQTAAQHGGAGDVRLARLEHDCLVERLAVVAIVLADEDAQKLRLLGKLHKRLR